MPLVTLIPIIAAPREGCRPARQRAGDGFNDEHLSTREEEKNPFPGNRPPAAAAAAVCCRLWSFPPGGETSQRGREKRPRQRGPVADGRQSSGDPGLAQWQNPHGSEQAAQQEKDVAAQRKKSHSDAGYCPG